MLKKLPKPLLCSEMEETPLPSKRKEPPLSAKKKARNAKQSTAIAGNTYAVGRKTPISATKRRLATIIRLASEGCSVKAIAAEISLVEGKEVTPNAIRAGLYKLRKKGELSDTEEKLTYMAAPLAADAIISRIEKELEEGLPPTYGLETLKGLGFFKTHTAQKTEGNVAVAALQVVFQQDGGRQVEVKSANIVGSPQTGEVIDV